MKQLHSYLQGSWKPGIGDDISLLDPTTEGAVAVWSLVGAKPGDMAQD